MKTLTDEELKNMRDNLSVDMLLWLEQLGKKKASPRWLSIAKTHFEQGFMAADRATLEQFTPEEPVRPSRVDDVPPRAA